MIEPRNSSMRPSKTHPPLTALAAMLCLALAACQNPAGLDNGKAMDTFSIVDPAVSGIIDEGTGTIRITLPFDTDPSALVAVFETTGAQVKVRGLAQTSGVTANDFSSPLIYKVHAADGSITSYLVTTEIAESDAKELWVGIWGLESDFDGETGTFEIFAPYGFSTTSLAVTFWTSGTSVRIGDAVQASGVTANNFSSPLTYTVTAADGSTADFTVKITVALNPAKDISTFSLPVPGMESTIDQAAGTIETLIPYWNGDARTSLAALVAGFATTGESVHIGSTAQHSGITANDFSSSLDYTVTAADGSTRTYTVTALIAPAPKAISAFSILRYDADIDEAGKTIFLELPEGTELTSLVPSFTLSKGASLSAVETTLISGVTVLDGSYPLMLRVTGDDGATADYGVTVVAKPGAPVISLGEGFIQTITIDSPTTGAEIRFTTDGSVPGSASRLYTAPLTVAGPGINMTVRAVAIKATATSAQTTRTIRTGSALSLAAEVSTLAGGFWGSGDPDSSDGTGATARFASPRSITSDGIWLYVSDTEHNLIRRVHPVTGNTTTVAGSGTAGYADGYGTLASFSRPTGITTDGASLYISDSGNNRIRKIVIATGQVTTLAGSGTQGWLDGTGTAARFAYPNGIVTDGTNLYVADGSSSIRRIVIATGEVSTQAGGDYGDQDGKGSAARFASPAGITTDGANLYFTDGYRMKIRKLVIDTGEAITLAGLPSEAPMEQAFADGIGTEARFDMPDGITCDGEFLYVADVGNSRIRKLDLATLVVSTLAGSDAIGSLDGTGAAAQFLSPYGIASDGIHLYVVDTSNNLIRKIE